jgi:hypothetical protein
VTIFIRSRRRYHCSHFDLYLHFLAKNHPGDQSIMAARGARARKLVERETKKEEAKQPSKQFADSLKRAKSRAGVATPSFTGDIPELRPQSRPNGSSVLSSSSSSHSKSTTDTSSALDKIARLGSRAKGSKSTSKYATPKGRGTLAPRGRLGGVPIKQETQAIETASVTKPAQKVSSRLHTFDETPRSQSGSSSGTATTFEKSWKNTKSWIGQGQKPRKYDGFEHVSHPLNPHCPFANRKAG